MFHLEGARLAQKGRRACLRRKLWAPSLKAGTSATMHSYLRESEFGLGSEPPRSNQASLTQRDHPSCAALLNQPPLSETGYPGYPPGRGPGYHVSVRRLAASYLLRCGGCSIPAFVAGRVWGTRV